MEQNTHPGMNVGVVGEKSKSTNNMKNSKQVRSKRLHAELSALLTDPSCMSAGISAFPDGENFFKWAGTIHGPSDSPYEGMELKLQMEFSDDYPLKPPNCKFTSPVWHPNVDMAGRICLDILSEKWSAAMDIRGLLLSLQSLLNDPNPNSPLNAQAANQWVKERESYNLKVKEHFKSKSAK